MKTLIIDNYDSFTFNLFHLIAEVCGETPLVFKNDELDPERLERLAFDNVVISPGPGRPDNERDFGVCRQLLLDAKVPLLGVCLGHQGLGFVYGGSVKHAPEPMHGRLSEIYHDGSGLFRNIPRPFSAVRYHSLIVEELPACLQKTAWTEDGLLMGLRHRERPFWGVQFHPESICTEYGRQLLQNFAEITHAFLKKRRDGCEVESARKSNFYPAACAQATAEAAEYEVSVRRFAAAPDAESAFVHLFGDEPAAFWLDSSLVAQTLSRFSFMGGGIGPNGQLVRYRTGETELTVEDAACTRVCRQSIFEYLNGEITRRATRTADLPFDFNCGFVGYFGYELKAECGATEAHRSCVPDAAFLLADRVIAFDHLEQMAYLLCLTRKGEEAQAEEWFDRTEERLAALPPLVPHAAADGAAGVQFRLSRPFQTYLEDVEECLREIRNGESYEVCLTNKVWAETDVEPLPFYRMLRSMNPAPYSAFLKFGNLAVACSSPERFLRVGQDGAVESKPIKGTLRRGASDEEDLRLREQLRNSVKDRAENLMIVDLMRNDLGRVCEVGSVHVPKLMDVESYATVHQLVSTVRGSLRPELTAVDCVRAAFPGGSMTGAPKLRTMEIIDRIEKEPRGVYSGALGYLALNGSADLNIVIRTALFDDGEVSIGVGGAVVSLSDPRGEFDEMLLKAHALMKAIQHASLGHSVADEIPVVGWDGS